MAISANKSGTALPKLPVAGSMNEFSEEPWQKDPFATSFDRVIPAKSVARLWVIQPAIVMGADPPPMEIVPMVTGIPHSAPWII